MLVTTGKRGKFFLQRPDPYRGAGLKPAVPLDSGNDLPGVEDCASLLARQEPYDSPYVQAEWTAWYFAF